MVKKAMKEGSIMVSNMKNKLKAGNTLSFVLILLIIVSIISMALVYSISYTTRTRLDKSHKNYETIILQNKGYEVLNLYIEDLNESSSLNMDTYKETFVATYKEFLEDDKYQIKFEEAEGAFTMRFKIGYTDDEDALLVEATYEYSSDNTKIIGYQLKKWGMTKWI